METQKQTVCNFSGNPETVTNLKHCIIQVRTKVKILTNIL